MAIKAKGTPKVNVSYEGEETGNGGLLEFVLTIAGLATILPIIFKITLWEAIRAWWALVW